MMILRLLFIAGAVLLISPALHAEERASDVIRIEQAFARAAIPGMSMSGAFMTFHNDGQSAHQVVSASSDAAKHVELHGHVKEKGMMRMRQMAHFHLPSQQQKALQPGGLHIMLIGLQESMQAGDTISMQLGFEDGSHTQITIPVKSISAKQ